MGSVAHLKGGTDRKQIFTDHLIQFVMWLLQSWCDLYFFHIVLMAMAKTRLKMSALNCYDLKKQKHSLFPFLGRGMFCQFTQFYGTKELWFSNSLGCPKVYLLNLFSVAPPLFFLLEDVKASSLKEDSMDVREINPSVVKDHVCVLCLQERQRQNSHYNLLHCVQSVLMNRL